MHDRDDEVAQLRHLLQEHGLLPEHPAGSTPDVSPEDDARLLARVLADPRVAGTAPGVDVVPATRGPRRGWVRATWAAAACLTLALALGIGQLRSAPQAEAGTPAPLVYSAAQPQDVATAASARAALLELAATAGGHPVTPTPGPVQFVGSIGWYLEVTDTEATAAVVPTVDRWWLAPDGSGRLTQLRSRPLDVEGRTDPTLAVSPAGPISTDAHPAGSLDPDHAATLPRDPAALTQALLDDVTGLPCDLDPTWYATCLVTAVTSLSARYVVPPDLAAATWTVLAEVPELSDLGTTTDRLGRPARAVAVPPVEGLAQRTVTVLVISTTSADLLGTETVTLAAPDLGITNPTVTGFTAWTGSGGVSEVGVTP